MDIALFHEIINDKHGFDYKKLHYKYREDFGSFLNILHKYYYTELPLKDFDGNNLVFIDILVKDSQSAVKTMLKPQTDPYGMNSAEEEIISTASIESIDFTRDSVHRILKGMAPENEQEDRILGLKRGLEFIADTSHRITEENLLKLYKMTVNNYLPEEDRLLPGRYYRHDSVFIVSDKVEHTGLPAETVPEYMSDLIDFINRKDNLSDLAKASIIHFYFAYVHPYFDGNGRMARLMHLWFLIQKGYQSALFIPFSKQMEKTRKAYYNAYTSIEENRKFSGVIDVTPFISYISKNVYDKVAEASLSEDSFLKYDEALKNGVITQKETLLWKYVLSYYGTNEFSTKQLEKDFGNAAYATIRSFVLKFERLGLLKSARYGARVRYRV